MRTSYFFLPVLCWSCSSSDTLKPAETPVQISVFETYCKLDRGMPSPIFDANGKQTSTCVQIDEYRIAASGATSHYARCDTPFIQREWTERVNENETLG